MALPQVYRVRQTFEAPRHEDPAGAVAAGLARCRPPGLRSGARVAVAIGSRGIRDLTGLTRAVVDAVRAWGARPLIVPAMGSHGGATGPGQTAQLAELGVSETTAGCPVASEMEVAELGRTPGGVPVYFDRNALDADGVIVLNRVKPHTAFRGTVESGLCKMLAVGLGKQKGAETLHRAGLGRALVEAARVVLERVPVVAGVAVLENYLGETAEVHVVAPERFEEADGRLLLRAWELLPRIPFDPLDVLVVDEMGKDVSGTGMDTNVIGVGDRIGGKMAMGTPVVSTVVVLGLTEKTRGNATGVGLADVTTRRLADAIDFAATYTNVATTRLWASGRLPVVQETDRAAVELALGSAPPEAVRLVRIRNTLRLEELEISAALLPDALEKGLTVAGGPTPLGFDPRGRLSSWARG